MPRPREFDPDTVLNQAMLRFWERGYRATSVEDLVKATGVNPGSLYGAFPGGKHTLFLKSLERYSNLVVPRQLGALEGPDASITEIRGYFDAMIEDMVRPEGRQGCLLVNSAIENAAEDDEVAAVVRGHLARLEGCVAKALSNAIGRGEARATLDPVGTAKLLVATGQGLMVVGKANPDRDVLLAIVDNAFAGIAAH
ncbi:MAG TPA: TetR/AcrR family transcriptional regulator [Pseudonocardiaceae bacterium]|nr:TetR/AcrR family transcriptional regulator [Pseudonocardiaceae bacterium]